jgi:hypothetical protein
MDVVKPDAGLFMYQLLLLVAFIIPAVFFLIAQQQTLKAIQPVNRMMEPGMVWLQMIPLLGFVWQFFVVSRIAASIKKELASKRNLQGEPLYDMVGKYPPTLFIGILYATFFCLSLAPLLKTFCALMTIICWITYWIELASCKKKIQVTYQASPPDSPSQIPNSQSTDQLIN